MSDKASHICSVCGTEYHYCPDCNDAKSFTPWRTIVDTIEHYKIFLIIRDYTNKDCDISGTKKLLLQIDLTDLDNFVPEMQSVIESILSYKEVQVSNQTYSKKKK
jgi:hypothetical protein